jgi:hypothetical protein
MDCGADPRRGGLAGIMGFGIVGSAEEPRCRGDIVRLPPPELRAVPQILLEPDSAQNGHRGDLPQPRRGVRVIDGGEQLPAVVADAQCEGSTGCLCGREPVIFSPPRVAVPPVRVTHRAYPRRGANGGRMQGVAPRFADHLEPVQGPYSGANVGGVRALPAPRFDELAAAAPSEQRSEAQGLRCSGKQSGARFTEDRGIEPRICPLQAQDILPVEAATSRVRCLAVRSAFGTLEDCHQPEAPGRTRWLPRGGKTGGEECIRKERVQLVGQASVARPFRKGGRRDTPRFRGTRVYGVWAQHTQSPDT